MATDICGCGFSGCKLGELYNTFHARSKDANDYFTTHGTYSFDLEALASAAYSHYLAEIKACDERYDQARVLHFAMQATKRRRKQFAKAIALGMAQVYSNKQCGATMLCMRGAR